jgi:hypothetical protein
MSGHIFFAHDYYGFDDAIYAAVRLISAVSDLGGSLTALKDAMPALVNTPEMRFQVDESRKFAVVDEVLDRLEKQGAKVDRARASDFGADGTALSRAIDPDLNDFVVEPGAQAMRNFGRVRAREYYVSRDNVTHDIAVHVGHVLLTDVEDVDRKRGRPVRARRQDEGQCVANTGDRLRVMDRQLTTVLLANRCRVPPDAFAARFPCDHRLAHANCLRTCREQQEKRAFASGRFLCSCAARD